MDHHPDCVIGGARQLHIKTIWSLFVRFCDAFQLPFKQWTCWLQAPHLTRDWGISLTQMGGNLAPVWVRTAEYTRPNRLLLL